MEISNVKQKHLFMYLYGSSSFYIRLNQLSQVWLFNCLEGCQHVLATRKIKISHIRKIVLTDCRVKNISGLIGLLSSISLNTKVEKIDVYGPKNLGKYLFLSRRYSRTNFRYKLYIHDISKNLIIRQFDFSFYVFMNAIKFDDIVCILFASQQSGPFDLNKAILHRIPFGPLCGRIKTGSNFILPDGCSVNSNHCINGYYLGSKAVLVNRNARRCYFEALSGAVALFD